MIGHDHETEESVSLFCERSFNCSHIMRDYSGRGVKLKALEKGLTSAKGVFSVHVCVCGISVESIRNQKVLNILRTFVIYNQKDRICARR